MNDTIQATHAQGAHDAAKAAREMMGQETAFRQENGIAVMNLGLADMCDVLDPAIDRGLKQ
ncbi:MAG: hypothetical protein WC473_03155 [Patescibacteria group bacterium]|jgi:hypothetical protein